MKYISTFIAMSITAGILLSSQAKAQNYNSSYEFNERLQALEKDIQSLMRQNYQGSGSAGNTADAQVRLTQIEEELRALRGQIEEGRFKLERIERDQQLMNEQVEFRLGQLERSTGVGGVPGLDGPSEAPAQEQTETPSPSEQHTIAPPPAPVTPEKPIVLNEAQKPITQPPAVSTPQGAREAYNNAISLMNRAQYAEAGRVLENFTQTYAGDPLIGNAYYWLGETFYVRENYVAAADNFRKGFEALPNGQKAPDNLLKLAKSLSMLNKKKEACVVFRQLQKKYAGQADAVLYKAKQEEQSLGCQ